MREANLHKNIDAKIRVKIILEAKRLKEKAELGGKKFSITRVAKICKVNRKTVYRWLNRQSELENGRLEHRRRSGRTVHSSFFTKENLNFAIDLCENLPFGKHQKDAADILNCSVRTRDAQRLDFEPTRLDSSRN